MTLINLLPWLERALHESYAIGAFNANTLEQFQAITAAAEAEKAPVIIQVSYRALKYLGGGDEQLGLRYAVSIARAAAQDTFAPIALHLDHAPEPVVRLAIAAGFTSVMFDSGDIPLAENIRQTRLLSTLAHEQNICLEGELGEVPRADSRGRTVLPPDGLSAGLLTDPDQAAEFFSASGIDTLAVAVGSVHALHHKTTQLDLERLRAIRQRVSIPLVLHGSSGVTDASISAGIRLGLCKVNIATQLNQVFTSAIRNYLSTEPTEVDPRKYLALAREAMTLAVRERIRFLGSADRA